MDSQEGLEYKKQILVLIRKAGITDFSELPSQSSAINDSEISSEEEGEEENLSEKEANITNSVRDNVQIEAMKDFQMKLIQMKKYFNEFPTLTAQLNMELEMMTNEPRVIASSNNRNSFGNSI